MPLAAPGACPSCSDTNTLDRFDPASSSSYKASFIHAHTWDCPWLTSCPQSDSLALQSTFTNPYAGNLANPTSQLLGTFFEDVIRDARQDPWTRKMVQVTDASDGLPAGSAGYWGLGVDAVRLGEPGIG